MLSSTQCGRGQKESLDIRVEAMEKELNGPNVSSRIQDILRHASDRLDFSALRSKMQIAISVGDAHGAASVDPSHLAGSLVALVQDGGIIVSDVVEKYHVSQQQRIDAIREQVDANIIMCMPRLLHGRGPKKIITPHFALPSETARQMQKNES